MSSPSEWPFKEFYLLEIKVEPNKSVMQCNKNDLLGDPQKKYKSLVTWYGQYSVIFEKIHFLS